MSQQNQNVDHSNYSIIAYVGGTAILAVFVSETYSSIETQKLKHEESTHDDEDEDEDDEEMDDNENEEDDTEINAPVSECSWFIVGLSFLGTSSYSAIYFTYTLNPTESKYWQIAFIISPMAFVSFMMAFFMKSKRNDCKYKIFHYFHFTFFAFVSEISSAIGNFRNSSIFYAVFAILRLSGYVGLFRLGLMLRDQAARLLNPKILSELICTTVLVRGTAAMGPILFFSFETVSCVIEMGGFEGRQCENSSMASFALSIYLAILVGHSFFIKTVPRSVMRQTEWEYGKLAALDLRFWQKVEGICLVATFLISLYLLSSPGVEGEPSGFVQTARALGAGFLALGTLVSIFMVAKTHKEHRRASQIALEEGEVGARTMISGELQRGMVLNSFV
ncbi:hypothetical protein TrLO_g3254 [Triparma laevis f. longispina]|uniref:Uncharacterized protein n=1 Tax=Triparma laevis f. longispina TaxID=1714387 RepID=A0A9W7ABW5_9STRA|nr:hypothetical protein TrLO_g3254 [Triparma laevis f. longispina]